MGCFEIGDSHYIEWISFPWYFRDKISGGALQQYFSYYKCDLGVNKSFSN